MFFFCRQSKPRDAKEISYLSFYSQPKSKIEAFLVGVSHTYLVSLYYSDKYLIDLKNLKCLNPLLPEPRWRDTHFKLYSM